MSKSENPNQGKEIEIISIDQREIELLEKNRKINLQKLFTPEGMDVMIAEIQKEVADFSADISTKEGRAKIISMAAKVAKCKSPIKNLASELKEESRRLIDGVNAQWNRYEKAMDELRDQIRKPVDEIEEREARILKEKQDRLVEIERLSTTRAFNSVEDVRGLIKDLEQAFDFDWGDFQFAANVRYDAAKNYLESEIEKGIKYEEEQAELTRLRKEAAERAQKDHEEKIAREAAEKAKREAEELAERERKAAIEREAKIEADKKAAEERAKEAERLAIEQAEKAELARIAAEKKAKEDAEKAALEAVEKERLRVAEEKRKEEEAAEKREANKRHRAKINCEASAGLVKLLENLSFPDAEILIEAIARGEIKHVQINY